MKTCRLIIIMLMVIVATSSCHHYFGQRKTTIRITDDNNSIEIKYRGDIEFSDDNTSIVNMSPNAYLRYKKNSRYILAESDDEGEITYEQNGVKQDSLTETDKRFFSRAIKEIIKARGR